MPRGLAHIGHIAVIQYFGAVDFDVELFGCRIAGIAVEPQTYGPDAADRPITGNSQIACERRNLRIESGDTLAENITAVTVIEELQ